MRSFISAVLTYRYLVIVLSMGVACLGSWSLRHLPIDAVPDITTIQVQITTIASALSTTDVEHQVTFPIETSLAGIPSLAATRSISRGGFSQVTAIFNDGTDLYFARSQVLERLIRAREFLPAHVEPSLGPIATGLGEVIFYTLDFAHPGGVEASTHDGQPGWQTDGSYRTPDGSSLRVASDFASYLRTVQDWVVTPQLRLVEGVADVDTIGGYEKQYVISPDPARLTATGISVSAIHDAITRNHLSVGAGYIERNGESYAVRGEGRLTSIEDLASIPLTVHDGVPLLLKDVACISIGHDIRSGSGSRDGRESVIGTVLMRPGMNSRSVAERAAAQIHEINRSLPEDILCDIVINRQTLVDAVIHTVKRNLTEGAVLVVIVLVGLLGSIRGAIIAAMVIPLSMLLAAAGMLALGISGNLMSLGAIDFGIIVDTAVIVVENCLRSLGTRQRFLNRPLTLPERLDVVREATSQMINAAVFGQAIIAVVYVPILLLTGVEGKMFHPMAMTVLLCLASSFVFSLTIVPALVALVVRHGSTPDDHRIMRWLDHWYVPILQGALRWRWLCVGMAMMAAGGAAMLYTHLGAVFVPRLAEGSISMEATRMPSIGMEQVCRMQLQAERAIASMPEIHTVIAKTGTADLAFDPMPWTNTDVYVTLKPTAAWPHPSDTIEQVRERVEHVLTQTPGTSYEFSQPIEQRFNELISGVKSDVAITIFGDDFTSLSTYAHALAAVLAIVPGAVSVHVAQMTGQDTVTITPRRALMARLGIDVDDALGGNAALIGGSQVGDIVEGDRRVPIVIRLDEAHRTIAALKALPVSIPMTTDARSAHMGGQARTIPLSEIADLIIAPELNQVTREDGRRNLVVRCNVRNRDLVSFVSDAQRMVAAVPAVPGTWVRWGGTYQHYIEATKRLAFLVPMCFLLIVGLLVWAFGAVPEAILVFTAVPLALSGGVLALWARGIPFSISAAVGFIAVSGVAVLNGLVLVSSIQHLRASGSTIADAIREGCRSRLRPVVMTAVVASLGFLPMAFATGEGAEVQRPLATVVMGGIMSSTLLTLLLLPIGYGIIRRDSSGTVGG